MLGELFPVIRGDRHYISISSQGRKEMDKFVSRLISRRLSQSRHEQQANFPLNDGEDVLTARGPHDCIHLKVPEPASFIHDRWPQGDVDRIWNMMSAVVYGPSFHILMTSASQGSVYGPS